MQLLSTKLILQELLVLQLQLSSWSYFYNCFFEFIFQFMEHRAAEFGALRLTASFNCANFAHLFYWHFENIFIAPWHFENSLSIGNSLSFGELSSTNKCENINRGS